MIHERPTKILEILHNTFSFKQGPTSSKDSFATLVITIISQSTTAKNTATAFERLSKNFRITPEELAKAKIQDIESCVEVAGLHRNKSRAIKRISEILVEKHQGDINRILALPMETARKALLSLPGVGPKTADVVLLFAMNRPTIPVDTHVERVSKRLGLAPANGGYEDVRQALQSLFPSNQYLKVHVLLIEHGRRYCRARRPLCIECPLRTCCPSKNAFI